MHDKKEKRPLKKAQLKEIFHYTDKALKNFSLAIVFEVKYLFQMTVETIYDTPTSGVLSFTGKSFICFSGISMSHITWRL